MHGYGPETWVTLQTGDMGDTRAPRRCTMPWLETAPMRERLKFIGLALSEMYTMSELCSRCGISRKAGYKWITPLGAAPI